MGIGAVTRGISGASHRFCMRGNLISHLLISQVGSHLPNLYRGPSRHILSKSGDRARPVCVAVVECAHCPCVEALGRARIRKHGPWRRVGAITGRYSHCHIRVLTGCSQGTHRSQRRSRYISRRGQAYGSGVGRAWVERRSSESSRAAGAGLGSRRGYATQRATQVQHGGTAHTSSVRL